MAGKKEKPSEKDLSGKGPNQSPAVQDQQLKNLIALVTELQTGYNALLAYVKTHTHSGVTAGAANSGAPTVATTAATSTTTPPTKLPGMV